jgi:hypothetical protein
MKIIPTNIANALIFEPEVLGHHRATFLNPSGRMYLNAILKDKALCRNFCIFDFILKIK